MTLERLEVQECQVLQVLQDHQVLRVREEWSVHLDFLERKVRMDDDCIFFTARLYVSAVYAVVVCSSVRPSVKRRYCTITDKRRITQTAPYDSLGTLVF